MSGLNFIEKAHIQASGFTYDESIPESLARSLYGDILDSKLFFSDYQQQAFDACEAFPLVKEYLAACSIVYLHAARNSWDSQKDINPELLKAANPECEDGRRWEEHFTNFFTTIHLAALRPFDAHPTAKELEERRVSEVRNDISDWLCRHFPIRKAGSYPSHIDYCSFIATTQMDMVFVALLQEAIPVQVQQEWVTFQEVTRQAMHSMIDYSHSFK